MKKYFNFIFSLLFATLVNAQEIQSSFTLDGVLYDSSGQNTLLETNVTVRVQILNPAKTCILYDETRIVDTHDSNGYFSLQIGSAQSNPRRTSGSDPNNDFKKIFQNSGAIVATGCSGNIYNPLANDIRYVRLIVTPNGGSPNTLQPDMILGSNPVASQARELNGKNEFDFIQTTPQVTQSNAVSIFSNTTALVGLAGSKTNIDNLIINSSNFVTQSNLTTLLSGKQNSLGFTPLNQASNLSDLSSVSTARTNLGLGALATLHTVPNDKTTANTTNAPNTIMMRDSSGFYSAEGAVLNSSIILGETLGPELVMTTTDLPSPSGYLTLGTSIIHTYNKGDLGIYTGNDATNDAIPTNNLTIETGNKLAGTGDSGSILLSIGTSAGGERGEVYTNGNLMPTEDNMYSTGSIENRWANVWGSFVSASDSLALRDPVNSTPVMGISIFNNGTNTGPFLRGPFTNGQYSGFGIIGRNNGNNNSFNTENLWLTTGSKANGTGNTGQIIIQPGFAQNGGVRGDILLNSLINVNGNRIVNVPAPIASSDAVNKNYVDSSVNAATSSLTNSVSSANCSSSQSLYYNSVTSSFACREIAFSSSLKVNDPNNSSNTRLEISGTEKFGYPIPVYSSIITATDFVLSSKNNDDQPAMGRTSALIITTGNNNVGSGDTGSISIFPGYANNGGVRGKTYLDGKVVPAFSRVYADDSWNTNHWDFGADLGEPDRLFGDYWGRRINFTERINLMGRYYDPNTNTSSDFEPYSTIEMSETPYGNGPMFIDKTRFDSWGVIGIKSKNDPDGIANQKTHDIVLMTGDKNGGTGGGTGNIILRPGLVTNGGTGFQGQVIVNGNININGVMSIFSNLNMAGFSVSNLAMPITGGDAANKAYVDGLVSGVNGSLHSVAFSGDYNQLNNKPTLGTLATLNQVSNANISDVSYSKLTNLPSSFTPSAHSHAMSDVTGLSSALSLKLDVSAVSATNCSNTQGLYWNSVSSQFQCQNLNFPSFAYVDAIAANTGANNALSNLSNVSINADLVFSDLNGSMGTRTISTGQATIPQDLNGSDNLLITSGPSGFGSTGSVSIKTSNATNMNWGYGTVTSGGILLQTGTASNGPRGNIVLNARNVDLSNTNIINLALPILGTDAVNKNYTDSFGGTRSLTTSNGTTQLLETDTRDTVLFGTSPHVYKLPSTANLTVGNWWRFVNRSSASVTIQSFSSTNLAIIPSQTVAHIRVSSIATESWFFYVSPMISSADGSLNFAGGKGVNVATPTTSNDAANKSYVDSSISSASTESVKTSGIAAPKLCSFYVSNGTGVSTVCSSAGCTSQKISGGCANVGSVTRTATGAYTYTFVSGYWSNPSQVSCQVTLDSCNGGGGRRCYHVMQDNFSSTQRTLNFEDSGGVNQDASFAITCHGE